MFRIDRCVCMNITFAELLERARRERLDVDGLERVTGCGGQCGLCVAYIEEALRSGRTVFHEVLVRGAPFSRARSGAPTRES